MARRAHRPEIWTAMDTERSEDDRMFISTQVQGRLEDLEAEDARQRAVVSRASSLRGLSAPGSVPKPMRPPRDRVTKPRKQTAKQRRIKSITSYVAGSHVSGPLAVLQVLSGKKKKVRDILRSVRAIEDGEDPDQHPGSTSKDAASTRASFLYNREEWFHIVRNLNLHFPHLSRRSKLPISVVTDKYLRCGDDDGVEVDLKMLGNAAVGSPGLSPEKSLWKQASSPPSETLTREELCWLYDVDNDEDDNGLSRSQVVDSSFTDVDEHGTATLSQVLRSTGRPVSFSVDADAEIPNSSPELEPLTLPETIPSISVQVQAAGHSQANPIQLSDDSFDFAAISQPASKLQVLKSFADSANANLSTEPMSTEDGADPSAASHEVITSSPARSASTSRSGSVGPTFSNDWGTGSFERNASPLTINQLPDDLERNEVDEASVVEEAQFDAAEFAAANSSLASSYSTAPSDFYYTQRPGDEGPPQQTRSTVKIRGKLKNFQSRKSVYKTSKLNDIEEVSFIGAEAVYSEDEDGDVSIITTRIVDLQQNGADADADIVPNSSSEEEEECMIEIIREVKNGDHKGNASMIEVSSSQLPRMNLDNVLETVGAEALALNSLAVDPNSQQLAQSAQSAHSAHSQPEVEDFTKFTAEELKIRLNSWGLKVAKSKAKMIETLSQASRMISESQRLTQSQQQLSQGIPETALPDQTTRESIFNVISAMIKEDRDLYTKILMFTPLYLGEISGYLAKKGKPLDDYLIRDYCDATGITLVAGELQQEGDGIDVADAEGDGDG